jgi:type I protein arginine methyltransferase
MEKLRKIVTLFDDYHSMLADSVRMERYEKAIQEVVREGDVVVDLGAGLGILSFLAVRAGARKVYAIEKLDSIELARRVAALNGVEDKIVFLRENSTDVTLPEKADVLISETLGSFALEENTLTFTIDARERFLKPGGRMLPEQIQLWLAPVEVPDTYAKMEFWKDVCGFDFSPARDEMTRKLLVEDVAPGDLLAEPARSAGVDLRTVSDASLRHTVGFVVQRAGTLHGLAGWFEVQLSPSVIFDTAPGSPPTHWRQAFLPLKEPLEVRAGDSLASTLWIKPGGEESDDLQLSYDVLLLPTSG